MTTGTIVPPPLPPEGFPSPVIDRKSLTDLIPLLIAIVVFSLFGGGVRLLAYWVPAKAWQRKVGEVAAAVLAGFIVGLPASEYPWIQHHIGAFIALVCTSGWGGIELVDISVSLLERVAARLVIRRTPIE